MHEEDAGVESEGLGLSNITHAHTQTQAMGTSIGLWRTSSGRHSRVTMSSNVKC